jgi:hypothetical protein
MVCVDKIVFINFLSQCSGTKENGKTKNFVYKFTCLAHILYKCVLFIILSFFLSLMILFKNTEKASFCWCCANALGLANLCVEKSNYTRFNTCNFMP